MTPSLELINLLELLTELRKTFYLLAEQFYEYNLGPVTWKRHVG